MDTPFVETLSVLEQKVYVYVPFSLLYIVFVLLK